MQGLDYWEGEELSWCPSWSNSLWQGWSCGLVYCPAGNATDPISIVLAPSDRIYSWTPLKPQHSNPELFGLNSGVLSFYLRHLSFPHNSLPWISYATQKMLDSGKTVLKAPRISSLLLFIFRQHFWNPPAMTIALVGCIPIAAEAVDLNLKS